MGLKSFFQTAKQEAIEEIVSERVNKRLADLGVPPVAERADKLLAERGEQMVAERIKQLATERAEQMAAEWVKQLVAERGEQLAAERVEQLAAEARVRSQVLEELRRITPDEISDWLARETQAADGSGAGQS